MLTQIAPTETYTHQLKNELNAQHTIQSEDLLAICAIASRETSIDNIFEQISTWRFEQFFGLACHLFITTKSQQSRIQLSNLLPKFGSIAVVSLIKIAHHFSASTFARNEVGQLAVDSLKEMPLQTLVIGLAPVIKDKGSYELMPTLVPVLIVLAAHHQAPLFSDLAQQLPAGVWNTLQAKLLRELSALRRKERFNNRERHTRVRIENEAAQLVEVAC
ncbi:MAG: hypothetical protein WA883_18340 [Phormidesmis sp.]